MSSFSFTERKIELLQNAKRLTDAIDLQIDWYIAYLQEKDAHKKKLYYSIYKSKCEELTRVAKEVHEQHK